MKQQRVWLLWLALTAAVSAATTAAFATTIVQPPSVDMAIEWVPYVRPVIAPASSGTDAMPLRDSLGPVQTWTLRTDERRLSQALQRWCSLAGWQLVWDAERDFPIEVDVQMQGHFSSALEWVMKSLQDSDHPLQAVMNAQTRVVRVRRLLEGGR
jgi:hypothetical protein